MGKRGSGEWGRGGHGERYGERRAGDGEWREREGKRGEMSGIVGLQLYPGNSLQGEKNIRGDKGGKGSAWRLLQALMIYRSRR